MALQETVIPISFAAGLDTKSDKKQIAAGNLLTLQNGIFIDPKEIIKRNGYGTIGLGGVAISGSISNGNALGLLNNDVSLLDGTSLYTYMPDLDQFTNGGTKMATRVATKALTGVAGPGNTGVVAGIPAAGTIYPSSATIGDYKLVSSGFYGQTNVIAYSYIDVSADVAINQYSNLGISINSGYTVQTTQVQVFNGAFVLIMSGTDGSSNVINIYSLPAVPGAAPTLEASLTANAQYAPPSICSSSTTLYVGYYDASSNFVVMPYDTAFVPQTPITVATGVSAPSAGSHHYRNGLYILFDQINNELITMYSAPVPIITVINGVPYLSANTGSIVVARYTPTGTFISNVYTQADAGGQITGAINGTSLLILYEVYIIPPAFALSVLVNNTLNNPLCYIKQVLVQNYRTSPTQVLSEFAAQTYLYSSPIVVNGDWYYTVISNDIDQPIHFIIRVPSSGSATGTTVVGKFAVNTALYTASVADTVSPFPIINWDGISLPYLNAAQTTLIGGITVGSYVVNEITLSFDEKLSSIALADDLNIQGSIVSIYDGLGVAESGFNLFPKILYTGSNLNADPSFSYAYTAVYSWIDKAGNLHRSAPAVPVIITASAAIGSAEFQIITTTLGLSDFYKLQNVVTTLYRTTNGGTIFYELTSFFNGANINYPMSSFFDETADSSIIQNTQLYTTGGEVENIGPPPTDLMTEFKNRLIIVDAENPLQWWFSKQVIQGFPAEFSDVLVNNIDQKGGPITALSTMDDKLIFFKSSNIWYVIGDGPSPNGLNSDFTYPQIISSDTGCVNQSSIVLSPQGLFFQSPKGIYLLGRDLSLNYIGAPVEAFNSHTVTSAQMIAGTNQIRFSLNNGIVLVYDYFVKQWSTFTNIAAVDTAIFNGNYTYLMQSGQLNTETPGAYADPGAVPISLSLTTGWLSFAGLQNFQRVKQFLILGESESPTTLTVSLAYDFTSNINQVDNIVMTGSQQPMQYRIFTRLQKCETIQISLQDNPVSTTEGLRLSALAFNIAQKKGPFKMPAASTYG